MALSERCRNRYELNHECCRGSDVVDQIWVYGNSYESTLVAIVVPDKKTLMSWASENGAGSDFKAVCQKPAVSTAPLLLPWCAVMPC